MLAKEFINEGVDKETFVKMFSKFLPLAMEILEINRLPKMQFETELKTGEQPSFGMYSNAENKLYVALANRHPVDILRTVAHELVHFKQDILGELHDDSGRTGSPEENQAHEIAGIIMRHFNKQYPEFLKSKPIVIESAGAEKRERQVHDGSQQGVSEGKVINTYLWHGSRHKNPVLIPRQATDTGGAKGSNQNAIYATSDPNVAIAMGLTTSGSDTGMFPNDPQMVLFRGGIRKGQYVYLHKVPFNGPDGKPQFVQGGNSREFHSVPEVTQIKPTEIKEVPVNKYLNLIRKATPADLKLRKKYMKKQGVAENFADGRNPQDKGDSKRYNVPTKASVSTLRKVAKAGGRKGQLAHWMANMKAGRAKKK